MIVPIWVSPWELSCCQPEAQVGESWEARCLLLSDPEPWWAGWAAEPLTASQIEFGVIESEYELIGTAANGRDLLRLDNSISAVSDSPVGADTGRVQGRLHMEAHDDKLQAPELACAGLVRQIFWVPLVYRTEEPNPRVPCWQLDPTTIQSTLDRSEEGELLICLDVAGSAAREHGAERRT